MAADKKYSFGSEGERTLQAKLKSKDRAERFYDNQMKSSLTDKMMKLIARQEMMFIATADRHGECDCSPRFGAPGFVQVVDSKTLAYPEFRGNGVFASMGNILENPNIGIVFVDFFDSTVGLHVNGKAELKNPAIVPIYLSESVRYDSRTRNKLVEQWVWVSVEEAYIHCSKHVPKLRKEEKQIRWGTDNEEAKATDHFI